MAAEDAEEEVPEEGADGDGEESSDGQSKAGGKKKLILFIALPVILLLGGGAGAYFFGLLDPLIGEPPAEEALVEEEESRGEAIFYDLPEMLVNLNSPGRKNNYLKLSISLELDDSANIDLVESVLPRIVDNFQVYLRELRVEDLRGSAGLTRLREELLMRINIAARPAKVSDVLFREMLIQ